MRLLIIGILVSQTIVFAQSKKEQIELLNNELNDIQKQLDASRINYSTYKSTFEATIKKTSKEVSIQQDKIVELEKQISTSKEEKARIQETYLKIEQYARLFKDTNFVHLYNSVGVFYPNYFGGLISANGSNFEGTIEDDYTSTGKWTIQIEYREGGLWESHGAVLNEDLQVFLESIALELDVNFNLHFWYYDDLHWTKIKTVDFSYFEKAFQDYKQKNSEESKEMVIVEELDLPKINEFFLNLNNQIWDSEEESFDFTMNLEFGENSFSINIPDLMYSIIFR
jgi:hypothetical protein